MAIASNKFVAVPGVPASPNFLELVIRGHAVENVGTQKFLNILHFARVFDSGVVPVAANAAAAVFAPLAGPFSNALSVGYIADDYTGRLMDDVTFLPVIGVNTIVGAVAGDRLPSFNAVVTRKLTYARGRSYRGSNHWGPIAEADTTLDQLNAGGIANWNVAAAALQGLVAVADADGNKWTLCVLSTTLSTLTTNPTSFTGSLMQTCSANVVIGTMKRRKQGVGA